VVIGITGQLALVKANSHNGNEHDRRGGLFRSARVHPSGGTFRYFKIIPSPGLSIKGIKVPSSSIASYCTARKKFILFVGCKLAKGDECGKKIDPG
jgi:hypothetical protein